MLSRAFAAMAALMLLFGWPHGTSAATVPSTASTVTAPVLGFLQAAENLYLAAVKGDIPAMRIHMITTEARFRSLPMKRIATAEGVEALAGSIARMKRAAAAVSFDPAKASAAAAEIRLAADALAHPGKPLWHRYRPVLLADIDALSEAMAQSPHSAASRSALDRISTHYGLIRTSVLLQSETHVTERADSVLRYAGRVLNAPAGAPALWKDLIPSLKESIEGLFPEQRRNRPALVPPAEGPSWAWSAFMGTFIVAVLAWAGWRRHRTGIPAGSPGGTDRMDPAEMLLRSWRRL